MTFIKTLKNTIEIKKRKILIVFNETIADMLSNRKLNPTVTELFIRCRKLNIKLIFITQFYFAVTKSIRINYFTFKIPNKFNKLLIIISHILTLKT